MVNPFFGLITLLLWLRWHRTPSRRRIPFPSCSLTILFCFWFGGAGTHTYQKEAGHRHGQKFFQGIAVHLDSPVIINSGSLHSILQLAITMGFFLKNRNHRVVEDCKSLSWQGLTISRAIASLSGEGECTVVHARHIFYRYVEPFGSDTGLNVVTLLNAHHRT